MDLISGFSDAMTLLSARARADFSLSALKSVADQQAGVTAALVTGSLPDDGSGRGQLLDLSV